MTFTSDPAVAAIQFALETDEGIPFLHCWNEGNFDAIRREWPEAPESVFIGADPMHPETRGFITDPMKHPSDEEIETLVRKVASDVFGVGEAAYDQDDREFYGRFARTLLSRYK